MARNIPVLNSGDDRDDDGREEPRREAREREHQDDRRDRVRVEPVVRLPHRRQAERHLVIS